LAAALISSGCDQVAPPSPTPLIVADATVTVDVQAASDAAPVMDAAPTTDAMPLLDAISDACVPDPPAMPTVIVLGPVPNAGAIDTNPLPSGQQATPPPASRPLVPNGNACNATITSIDGPAHVKPGCPDEGDPSTWDNYGSVSGFARVYEAHVTVSGGATNIDVLWEKISLFDAIQNGSAPYRWCNGNGKQTLPPRRPFWCNMDTTGPDAPTGNVKAPMCSTGQYLFRATPLFTCPVCSGTRNYKGRPVEKTVTADATGID